MLESYYLKQGVQFLTLNFKLSFRLCFHILGTKCAFFAKYSLKTQVSTSGVQFVTFSNLGVLFSLT